MVMIRGIPQKYSSCKWHRDDEELKKMLEINGTKIADGYGCTLIGDIKFLYEKKSRRHIMKAIVQLQETAEKLIDRKQPLDEVFIVCETIGKPESGTYKCTKVKGKVDKFLYDKNLKKIVDISHNGKSFPIKLFYNKELIC